MPFKSEKQRRYLWANEPEIAKKWSNYNQGGVAMSLTQAAEMLRNVAQTQGREAAMMMLNRHRGTLSPREYDAGMNIINMNTGGMIRMNMGGNVPRYNAGGGLLNHPYQREGEQFDTVPAMLTPGEFVVDADSAHKFGDELEQINNWEPNGEADESGEEYISEDEAVEIKRKFKDGTEIIVKSPEGSKTEVSGLLSSLTKAAKRKGYEPQKKQMNRGGLLYANTGALVPQASIFPQAPQAPQATAPQAPQPAGLLSPQQQQRAQAQQMAGLGFSLLGDSNTGNQLSAMGRRALEGHQAAQGEQTKQDAEAEEKLTLYRSQLEWATKAIQQLNQGAAAVINFAISPAVRKLARAAAVTETRLSGLKEGVNLDETTKGYIVDAVNNYWGAQSAELSAYYALRQSANELRVIARKKIAGQGQVTEGEAEVVYNTVFGFDQPADTVANNLKNIIQKASKEIGETPPVVDYKSEPGFSKSITAKDLGLNVTGGDENSTVEFTDATSGDTLSFTKVGGDEVPEDVKQYLQVKKLGVPVPGQYRTGEWVISDTDNHVYVHQDETVDSWYKSVTTKGGTENG